MDGREKRETKGDRDIDRSRYRYIEGDLIEEAGKQKGNRGDERNPIYRTGGINRDIEISRNRYIEGEKKENKANNK